MSETTTWFPNWYVTRMHAVVGDQYRAKCGAHTFRNQLRGEWQIKRLTAGVPQCKRCLRVIEREATP